MSSLQTEHIESSSARPERGDDFAASGSICSSKDEHHFCVHQLFERQAAMAPERAALVFGRERLSYRDLDERANRLAHYLRQRGVKQDVLVGICLPRSVDLIVAVLAVLKSGGTYVPYDRAYPLERLTAMLTAVPQDAIITTADFSARLPQTGISVVCVDDDAAAISAQSSAKPDELAAPSSMCYAIFTSGSTGTPKLTGIYHRGWANLMEWFITEFSIGPSDRTLVMSSFSFDITQRSIAMPLISGGELHLIESEGYEPDLIIDTIERESITLMNCAPSTFYPLIEDPQAWPRLTSLRHVFLGGEAISASRIADWASSPACNAELVNVYGAAECSDVSAFYRLHDYGCYVEESVPIGYPIYNSQVFIVDDALSLQPEGSVGEICIAGRGVGRGYLNDAALTRAKFVQNPFSSDPQNILYRTGDLGYRKPDGTLLFKGRADHQIKVRGQRVELGDIEAALRQLTSVKEAIVVDSQKADGDCRLTAFVVPRRSANGGGDLADAWRSDLEARLPGHMVPNEFVAVPALPLSPNGKVDRQALLEFRGDGEATAVPAATAENETERLLSKIFADVLELPAVKVDASFFGLGGHSLLATRVIAKIRETFEIQLPRVDFYASPTVIGIAKKIDERRGRSPLS
jgi:amino acid adenylation domain-containing protein